MHKKLLIPGIIIISLVVSLYLFHQTNLNLQNSSNQQIESLLAELEWKNQIIEELNQQFHKTDNFEFDGNIEFDGALNKSAPVDRKSVQNMVTEEMNTTELSNQIQSFKLEINDLSRQLERQTNILRNLGHLAPFSKINLVDDELDEYFERMTEISQKNLYNSEYMMNPDKYGSIQFDTSNFIPETGKKAFEADHSKVYAHFDLPDYPYQSVLIKWYRQGVPEPIELGYFDINPNSGENYAWIEPKSSWGEGKYFVEIYSASESPELLSAGTYTVN